MIPFAGLFWTVVTSAFLLFDMDSSKSKNDKSSGVAFSAYDSEITISPSESASQTNNNFPLIFTSPLTSLRSLTKKSTSRSGSESTTPLDEGADLVKKIERSNSEVERRNSEAEVTRRSLLNMVRASVKCMIESSLSSGHVLDSDQPSLVQFFILMENVFQHRLKASKRFFGGNRFFWPALEAIERFHPSASSITESVRSLPGVKSFIGKCRAWLRLALMQKKFSDYFQVIVDNKQVFSEWYENDALLMNDEAPIMLGHLVGLNCLDANLCMKEHDLDNISTTIDYSLYVRDGEQLTRHGDVIDEESAMQKLVSQKTYLEERNRHLETSLQELRKKVEALQSTYQQQANELRQNEEEMESVRRENDDYVSKMAEIMKEHRGILQKCQADMETERNSLLHSKAELSDLVKQMKEQLKQETTMRLDAEKELEQEMSRRQELEVGLKLQEREIERKQEGLVVLREQLDTVKGTNADLCSKLQAQQQLDDDDNTSVSLENRCAIFNEEITKLKDDLEEANRQKDVAREQAGRYGNQLDDSEKARNVLTTNLQIEREWRERLEEEGRGAQQEITLLREKLEMFGSLQEEMNRVVAERDRLLEGRP